MKRMFRCPCEKKISACEQHRGRLVVDIVDGEECTQIVYDPQILAIVERDNAAIEAAEIAKHKEMQDRAQSRQLQFFAL